MKPDETGTPHTGKSRIVLSMEAQKSIRSSGGRLKRQQTEGDGLLWRLAHTTAMVEAWPGAKSLSVFFDVNEAGPQENRVSKTSKTSKTGDAMAVVMSSEAEGEVANESEEVAEGCWTEIVPNTRLSL